MDIKPTQAPVNGKWNPPAQQPPAPDAPTARQPAPEEAQWTPRQAHKDVLDNWARLEKTDPDRYARVMNWHKATGYDAAYIDANLDAFEKLQKRPTPEQLSGLAQAAPYTYDLLQNAQAAPLIYDDYEKMGFFERKVKKVINGVKYTARQQAYADLLGRQRAADLAAKQYGRDYSAEIELAELELADIPRPEGGFWDKLPFATAELGSQLLYSLPRAVTGAAAGAATLGAAGAAAGTAVPGAGNAAGAGGAALWGARLGFTAGLASYAYDLEGNLAYGDLRALRDKDGKPLPVELAVNASKIVGRVNAALETAGDLVLVKGVLKPLGALGGKAAARAAGKSLSEALGKVVGKIPGAGGLAQILQNNPAAYENLTLRQAVKAAAKDWALSMASETATEYAQNVVQEGMQELAKRESGQDFELRSGTEVLGDSLDGMMDVAAGTAGLGFLGALGGLHRHMGQVRQAAEISRAYEELGKGVKDLKLPARDPDGAVEYLAAQTDGTPMENVYVPIEALEREAQANGVSARELLQEIGPEAAAQYEEAAATGGDVEIKTAQWAVKAQLAGKKTGKPLYEALAKDIKNGPDKPSLAELERDQEVMAEEAKKADELIAAGEAQQTELDAAVKMWKNVLASAPVPENIKPEDFEKQADAAAQLMGRMTLVEAKKRKVNAAELAAQMPLPQLRTRLSPLQKAAFDQAKKVYASIKDALDKNEEAQAAQENGGKTPVLDFLIKRGGVRVQDTAWAGETANWRKKDSAVVGLVNNKSGMGLEEAAQAVQEHLSQNGYGSLIGQEATDQYTPDAPDLIEAVNKELPRYRPFYKRERYNKRLNDLLNVSSGQFKALYEKEFGQKLPSGKALKNLHYFLLRRAVQEGMTPSETVLAEHRIDAEALTRGSYVFKKAAAKELAQGAGYPVNDDVPARLDERIEPVKIKTSAVQEHITGGLLKEIIRDKFAAQKDGIVFHNEETGWDVRFSLHSAKKGFNTLLRGTENPQVSLAAMLNLDKLFAASILVKTHADRGGIYKNIHRFFTAAEIDGQLYTAKMTVKERKSGKSELSFEETGAEPAFWLYDLNLPKKIAADGLSASDTRPSPAATDSIAQNPPNFKPTLREVLRGVSDTSGPYNLGNDGRLLFQTADAYNRNGQARTDSAEFKAWFGASKVADENGRPLAVYHGTAHSFDTFQPTDSLRTGFLGAQRKVQSPVFFFTPSKQQATDFARDRADSIIDYEVKELYLSLQNPIDLTQANAARMAKKLKLTDRDGEYLGKNSLWELFDEQKNIDILKNNGYDGAIISEKKAAKYFGNKLSATTYIAFNPAQIKSVYNRGTWAAQDPNIYYQFAGENAATADKFALSSAQKKLSEGQDPASVRRETGWFKGADGKWRFEISDKDAAVDAAKLPPAASGAAVPLGKLLRHDKLYAAYPDLAAVPVRVQTDQTLGKAAAAVTAEGITLSASLAEAGSVHLRKALMHEVQHLVQRKEHFAAGASANLYFEEIRRRGRGFMAEAKGLRRRVAQEQYAARYGEKNAQAYADFLLDPPLSISKTALTKKMRSLGLSAKKSQLLEQAVYQAEYAEIRRLEQKYGLRIMNYDTATDDYEAALAESGDYVDYYQRQAGEVEARAAAKRLDLDEEERRQTPPEQTADVAQEEQIVRFDDGTESRSYALAQGASARGSYDPKKRVITLSPQANASTLIHELAHYWLEERFDYVLAGKADEAYLADFEPLKKYLEIKDGQKELTAAQHEKFAKSFEAYLREGVAPSLELKGVFARFRRWMLRLYKDVQKQLGVELNDDVRRVFDRMLASEEAIAAAERERTYEPFSKVPGLTDEDVERLKKWQEEAREGAVAQLMKEQMAQMAFENEQKRIYAEEKAYEQIHAQMRVLPQYQIADILESHFVSEDKLRSAKELAHMYHENMLSQEERTLFDMLCELNGYKNGAEAAELIVRTPPLEEAVDKAVQKQLEKHKLLKDMKTLRQASAEVLNNERALDVLALERELFINRKRTASVQRALERKEAAKKFAREFLRKKSARAASRFSPYYAAQKKAAKNAARSLAKQDWENAAKYKDQELLNGALAAESIRIRKRYVRALDYFQLVRRKPVRQLKRQEHWLQVAELLRRLEIPRTDYDPSMRVETLAEWAARMKERGFDGVAIPDWVMNEGRDLSHKRLNIDSVSAVAAVVKNVLHTANFEHRLFSMHRKLTLDELGQKVAEHLKKTIAPAERARYKEQVEPERDGAKKGLQDYLYSMTALNTLMHKADGYHDFGLMYETFVRPTKEAADKESVHVRRFYDAYSKLIEAHYTKKEWKALYEEKRYYPELGNEATKERLLVMALNMGNETNRKRLADNPPVGYEYKKTAPRQDNAWGEETVLRLLRGNLTAKDWDFVQGVWDLINEPWDALSQMHQRLTGFTPGKVEAMSFAIPTADGKLAKLRGGYFPIKYDPRGSRWAEKEDYLSQPLYTESNQAWFAATKQGHLKARARDVQHPLALNLNLVERHMSDVLHDLYFRPVVVDLRRLLDNEYMRAALRGNLGRAGYNQLKSHLNMIATGGQEYSGIGVVNKTVELLRRHTTIAVLAGKLSILVENFANPWLFANAVEGFTAADVLKGVGLALADYGPGSLVGSEKTKAFREMVFEKSALMKDKSENFDYTLRTLKQTKIFGKNSKLLEFTNAALVATDDFFAVPMWWTAYNKFRDVYLTKNPLPKNAALSQAQQRVKKADAFGLERADMLITRVLGSGRRYDAAEIIRSRHTLVRCLTMFATFMNNEFNRWARETGLVLKEHDALRYAGFVAGRLLVWSTMSMLLAGKWPDELEPVELLKWWLGGVVDNVSGMFIGLRDLAPVMVNRAMGWQSFGYRPTPLSGTVEDILLRPVAAVRGWAKGTAGAQDVAEALARTAAYAAPYPSQINSLFFNAFDYVVNAMSPRVRDVYRRRPKKERS